MIHIYFTDIAHYADSSSDNGLSHLYEVISLDP